MQENKTVAAVATPNSAGGIGIVRISGADALKIADSVFRAASGKSLCSSEGYRAHYGTITDSDESIDEGIALVFRAPKSYTGEDVVELSCHGGLYVTKRTLRAVLRAGALPAPAGEFTKRAFLNGRIDLAEAESVMALIGAQGEQAAAAAYNTLEGKLSSKISEIAHSLISVCAHMSAWVDYPDEEIEEILSVIPDLTKWANEIMAYATESEVNHGKEWNGFKVVEGRSVRKYKDESAVAEAAKEAGYKDIYRQSLITLTEMQKLMGKATFEKVLGDLIIKPPGKPTLVPNSDKREAMKISDAKNEFKMED